MSDNDQPTKHETEAGREFMIYAHGGVDIDFDGPAIACSPAECRELIMILEIAIARGEASEVCERCRG